MTISSRPSGAPPLQAQRQQPAARRLTDPDTAPGSVPAPIAVTVTVPHRPWTVNAERRGDHHWTADRDRTRAWRLIAVTEVRRRWRGVRLGRVDVVAEVGMIHPLCDTGNYYPSVKAMLDGCVDAGMLLGDTPVHVRSITLMAPTRVAHPSQEYVRLTIRGEPR